MTRTRLVTLSLTLVLGSLIAAVTLAPLQTAARPAHRFVKVADGVYAALATGAVATGSNSAIIVNAEDVMAVDSHITPAAARALVSEARMLTDRPVRYVVNTHFHFDHAHGNQIFPDDVLVIGHEFTREKLPGAPLGRSHPAFPPRSRNSSVRSRPRPIPRKRRRSKSVSRSSRRTRRPSRKFVRRPPI